MIPINNNLDDIIEKIERLADKIEVTKDEDLLYVYLRTYKAYCHIYNYNNKNNYLVSVLEIDNDDYLQELLIKKANYYFGKTNQFFLEEKATLQDIYLTNLSYLIDFFEKFGNSSYYKSIVNKTYKKIPFKELYDILINFLQEENKEMLLILEEFINEKKFFRLTDNTLFDSNAFSIFNPLEKDSLIFIRKNLTSIRYLEAYVHELAHVYDTRNLLESNNEFTVSQYNSNSIFNETLSTYYSFLLYDYLIKNSLYKDEAIFEYINTLISYSMQLDSASLICALETDDFLRLNNYIPTKKEIISTLKKNSKDFPLNNINNEYLKEEVNINETINYTYGYLLSKIFLQNKNFKEEFLKIRSNDLKVAELKEKGFALESNPKILTKRLEEYLD